MRRSRDRLLNAADDEADELQQEQHPGDRLQTISVGRDEGVARANRLDHRDQPFEQGIVERNGGKPQCGDSAHPHHHGLRVRAGSNAERPYRPWLVDERVDQQRQDARSGEPVEDDQYPQEYVGDRQCGGIDSGH
jgi:hypothetical protein